MFFKIIALISLFNLVVAKKILLSDKEYELLPPIFHKDSIDKCRLEGKKFCEVLLGLQPLNFDDPSEAWKLIEETRNSENYYDHSQLLYGLCLNSTNLSKYLSKKFSEEFQNLSLDANVLEINCEKSPPGITVYDYVLLAAMVIYFGLALSATVQDIFSRASNNLQYFSLLGNYHKIVRKFQASKEEKLRSIYGMKFYTSLWIILIHTALSTCMNHLQNPKYIEDFRSDLSRNSIFYLVQPFFFFSAFLLSYHTFRKFEKQPGIDTLKFVTTEVQKRYCRLVFPMLYILFWSGTFWTYKIITQLTISDVCAREVKKCQNTWWQPLLFVNSFNVNETCFPMSWYLSVDFQLYILSLFLLIFIIKFKRVMLIFTSSLVFSIALAMIAMNAEDMNVKHCFKPSFSLLNKIDMNPVFATVYFPITSNLPTYILGLMLGYICYKCDNLAIFTTKTRILCWYVLVTILPTVPFVGLNRNSTTLFFTLQLISLRLSYSLGLGIAAIGMSQNIGGPIKKLFEWPPIIFLGMITYSTYIVQTISIFSKNALNTKLLTVSGSTFIQFLLGDVILTIALSLFLFLTVEMSVERLREGLKKKVM